jgi:dipeptidase
MGIRGGPYLNPNYWRNTRLIGVSNVEYTSLVQCRSWLPDPIGGIEWLAFGPQDTSCYVPLYAGINDLPKSFSIGDHFEFNRGSARWAFDYVDFHTQVIYSEAIEDVKKSQLEYEAAAVQKTAEIDKQAQDLYAKSPTKAREFLTKYCLDNANKVVNAWWELGDKLLVKYNHFGFYDGVKRSRGRGKPYSQTWQKAVRMMDVLAEPEPQR